MSSCALAVVVPDPGTTHLRPLEKGESSNALLKGARCLSLIEL